jgi:exodeoxyribonuclease VII small subunit
LARGEKAGKVESFEQLYSRLEETVGKLEEGGLSLEDAIALYEQGMTLAKQCQERLDQAELKITRLRESFAAMPRPEDGPERESADDYEYATDDDEPLDGDEFP